MADALIERLNRRDTKWLGSAGIAPLFNPDGPEAASRIAELEAEIARRDAVAAASWGDQKDEWSDAIKAEHPVHSKDPERHRRFDMAVEMIGKRHGKYELVGMAAWLIARAERAEAKLATAVGLLGEIFEEGPVEVLFVGKPFFVERLERRAKSVLASIQERT